jgi:hypothetical protein
MVSMVILATTLWVCPGGVFSDHGGAGCKPFHEDKGTMNTNPDTPFESGGQQPASGRSSTPMAPSDSRQDRQPASDSVNSEMCALYKEYVELELKTQGGFQVGSPEESQRWQTLKRMFQNTPPPRCS